MVSSTLKGATSKREDRARLAIALAAIAMRSPLIALPSPAARHLLMKPKLRPAENPFPPRIGALRPPYNF
ncbi:MAG: hypothetical protein KDJ90_24420 [Nitratireductor sp.]|nr:hypothetical protein [Nitratireductor sp.]